MAKKNSQPNTDTASVLVKRAPVVSVLGHIDHGKSTLLDYIRKSNTADNEAGGITQSISAYEVVHITGEKVSEKITFIDTPGHAAFSGMRERGATTADVCILVVSAEDGVKPQTVEAYKQIKEAGVPFVVALTKIDKPTVNLERTKISLAESEIYLEGYGGDISYIPVSSKSGEGIDELLDLVLLTAEISELKGDTSKPASGTIIEAHRDPKKGISATIVIKDGTLKGGMFVACDLAFSPTRILEDFSGNKITEATFSSPLVVIGWNEAPRVGGQFISFESKSELEKYLKETKENINEPSVAKETTPDTKASTETLDPKESSESKGGDESPVDPIAPIAPVVKKILPVIVKADVLGSVEAIEKELSKIGNERVLVKVIYASIGNITESDIKNAGGSSETLVVGFNVRTDNPAKAMIERLGITYESFDIIYKLIEWVEAKLAERTPKIATNEVQGKAKILKHFSSNKDKQIVGGKVTDNEIHLGHTVKIIRRETTIGEGIIRELQQAKVKASTINSGFEFGAMIDSKIELAPGDIIEDFIIVEK